MPEARVPLFVRLPAGQAAALDRLVAATGRRKQALVSELLAGSLTGGDGDGDGPDAPAAADDVLTLDEAAELLRVPAAAVRARARAGALPGRDLGGEWRFARHALLAWLGGAEEGGRA